MAGFCPSPVQLALFPRYIESWKRLGLLTESISPERAAMAVKEAYRCAGKREPSLFLFVPSPFAGIIAAYLVSEGGSWKEMTRAALAFAGEGKERGEDWPSYVRETIVRQLATTLSYRPERARWNEILLPEGVGDPIPLALKEEPRTRFWKEVATETKGGWPSNWDALWASVPPATFQEIRAHMSLIDTGLWAPVQNEIWDRLSRIEQAGVTSGRSFFPAETVWAGIHACGYGSQDADWLSWFAFWSKEAELECGRQLYGLRSVTENCGWWWPFERACIISDRPAELHFDAQGRLHNATAPAIRYRDGFGVYAWKGRRVERYVVAEPVTVKRIEEEPNAEVRRILVERYGASNYVRDAGATEIDVDEFGVLYRKDQEGDDPIYVVKVICATTGNAYFLGIDPEAYGGKAGTSARAAVASLWRREDNSLVFPTPEAYDPEIET